MRLEAFPAFWALIVASLCFLPAVFVLIADPTIAPAAVLAAGLLSMGLAWAGGCAIEGRRDMSVRVLMVMGIASGGIMAWTPARDALGPLPVTGIMLGAAASAFALAWWSRVRFLHQRRA